MRYNKSLCTQACLYDPNKISKGHFVPQGGTMSYLEFSLSNKGGGLTSLSCHISLLVYFFFGGNFYGEIFISWYHNISLKNIKSNILMQLHNTFLWYTNVSGAMYGMILLSEAIQSTIPIYSSYSWFFIHLASIHINTWYWSVVTSEPESVQSSSKSRSTFDVFLL